MNSKPFSGKFSWRCSGKFIGVIKKHDKAFILLLMATMLLILLSCGYFGENNTKDKMSFNEVSFEKKRQADGLSKPLTLSNIHNQVITGLEITGGKVPAITLKNCSNIRITGNILSNSTDVGIHLFQCKDIVIDNNFINDVSTGVYVQQSEGGGIVIRKNQFLNMHGPLPRGQFVQFNRVNGPNCIIDSNICENILGASYAEDAINLYKSNGKPESPIIVRANYIRGGGPSSTGGGIALGDAGGSYQLVENNILINPGQYGIGVAGGTNMRILHNKIYARRNTFTNVGISVWNQYTEISGCSLITVFGNQVNWINAKGFPNPGWDSGNCGIVEGWKYNNWASEINDSILPAISLKRPVIRPIR